MPLLLDLFLLSLESTVFGNDLLNDGVQIFEEFFLIFFNFLVILGKLVELVYHEIKGLVMEAVLYFRKAFFNLSGFSIDELFCLPEEVIHGFKQHISRKRQFKGPKFIPILSLLLTELLFPRFQYFKRACSLL